MKRPDCPACPNVMICANEYSVMMCLDCKKVFWVSRIAVTFLDGDTTPRNDSAGWMFTSEQKMLSPSGTTVKAVICPTTGDGEPAWSDVELKRINGELWLSGGVCEACDAAATAEVADAMRGLGLIR